LKCKYCGMKLEPKYKIACKPCMLDALEMMRRLSKMVKEVMK